MAPQLEVEATTAEKYMGNQIIITTDCIVLRVAEVNH